jgi:RNA polymerase sigma-70 factor (ECF subfamily)
MATTSDSVREIFKGLENGDGAAFFERVKAQVVCAHSLPESTDLWANASDTTLVESVKSGNHSAYSELVKRHSTLAFRIAYRITQNKQDAEDAMQDSLFRAFNRINSFDGRSAFSTWLTRIAINTSLMILRKRRRRALTSLDDHEEIDLQITDPAPSTELLLVRLERNAAVRDAVRRLPPLLRSSIEARYWKEMSIHEAAALNGVTVAAAKSRQLRGRRELRTMLDQASGETDRCPVSVKSSP